MYKTSRTAILLSFSTLVFGGPDASASDVVVRVGAAVRVHDATPSQLAMVRWGVSRFRNAELELPPLHIYFHEDHSGCRGFPAFYAGDRINMCPGQVMNLVPRDEMLHELAHAWSVHALSQDQRQAFIRLRGLSTWNSPDQTWQLRGFEQTAEIVAWAIGDGVLTPTIPNNDPASLAAAYELLTGSALPAA